MRKKQKGALSLILAIVLIFSLIPFGEIVSFAATSITTSSFQTKYDAFKSNVYKDGSIYKDNPSATGGYECFGYANELAKYIFGSYPTSSGSAISNINSNWSITRGASAIDNLHIGDIVRFRYSSSSQYDHSIFVYKITGDTVYYTDANVGSPHNNVASRSMKKTTLKSRVDLYLVGNSSVKGYVAHYKGWVDVHSLTVQYNANGGTISNSVVGYRYTVVPSVGLNLRKAAGTSSAVIKTLKEGTSFDVYTSDGTKTANGFTWGKTTVGGDTGWVVISDSTLAKKGNAIRNPDYYLSSSLVYTSSSAKIKTQEWVCGTSKSDGLINASTFGLVRKGYTFVGWCSSADGSTTIFDQDDSSIKAEDINPKVKSSDQSSVLYAIWSENLKTVTNVEVAHLPDQTTYYVGETIDLTGLKLRITYSDDSFIETADCAIGDFDSSTPGVQTIPVLYQDLYTSFDVTVIEPSIYMEEDIHLDKGSSKMLSTTTTPSEKEIVWDTNDPEVATVENGFVTGLADGTTTIVAEITVNDISYTALCTVIVGTGVKEEQTLDRPQIIVESEAVPCGKDFSVTVSLQNNPGVMALTLVPKFSEELTLVKVENGELIPDFSAGKSYFWTANDDVAQDGVLLTLFFTVDESVGSAECLVSFTMWDSSNSREETVEFTVIPGIITVTDTLWGDANGDGVINTKDIVRLKNYLANYDDQTDSSTVELFIGADANGDGAVNSKDIVRLKNYFANLDDSGVSTVILGPA